MDSRPPPESDPKGEESPQDRFDRIARGLFEADKETVLKAEREFKQREKRGRPPAN